MIHSPIDTEADEGEPARALTLPEFTPVPRERMRRGGWSAERQRQFIELLAETGSVRAACRRMGVGEHHIYKLRRHPEAQEFRKAWEAALDCGIARLEDLAMDRALNGVDEPLLYCGAIIGSRTVYNDRLLMFMLRNRARERFGGDTPARGPDAIDRMKLDRMRKRWRREWEAEQKEKAAREGAEAIARIDAKLAKMAERRRARMSPATRAAEAAFHQAQAADRESREAFADHPLLPGLDWPEATCREELAQAAEWEALA
jgi:transposase-like protein